MGLVSGDVLLFDTQQWRLRKNLKVDDAITKLQFVGETPILVGSSMDGKIYKWDARTGEELFAGVGHNMGVLDFAILDGGKSWLLLVMKVFHWSLYMNRLCNCKRYFWHNTLLQNASL